MTYLTRRYPYKYLKVRIALAVQVKEQKINYGARKSLEEKMYVTRPLSMPSALSLPTPEGPNKLCILVIEDEEAKQQYTCFELCKTDELKDLPFPQNKNLNLCYSLDSGKNRYVTTTKCIFSNKNFCF